MKMLSRRLSKAAPLILLGLLLDHTPVNQSAQALVGGPFDNNQYPGATADGTYSATISGKNLIGMVSFGISSSSEQNGRFAIFHEGFVNYGAAAGAVDLASRRIFGSFLGVATLAGNGSGAGITETTGGSGNVTGATGASSQALTVRSSVEGDFQARLKGYPQQIIFEGEGRLSSEANNAILDGDATGGLVFTITQVNPSRSDTVDNEPTTSTGRLDGQLQVAQLRSETPFKIRGSRTSRTVYAVLNNYAAVPPIAPIAPATPVGTATPVATPVATATP